MHRERNMNYVYYLAAENMYNSVKLAHISFDKLDKWLWLKIIIRNKEEEKNVSGRVRAIHASTFAIYARLFSERYWAIECMKRKSRADFMRFLWKNNTKRYQQQIIITKIAQCAINRSHWFVVLAVCISNREIYIYKLIAINCKLLFIESNH